MTFNKLFLLILLQIIFKSSISAQYNIDAYLNKAQRDINENKYLEAIPRLNTCIEVQPRNSTAYFLRGICKFSLLDNIGAERDFTQAVATYSPIYYDAYRNRSMTRYKLANYAGAIDDLNIVISEQPKSAELYAERAFAYLANNNYIGAIRDCKKALSLKYFSDDVYVCKAASEDALVDYTNALIDYDLALTRNPKNTNAYVRRGITKLKMGNLQSAILDYSKAIEIDSTSTFAYYSRAEAEAKRDSIENALSDFTKVIYFEPRNAFAYFNRAVLNCQSKNYNAGIDDFSKVLTINPSNIQALFNRATLLQNASKLKDAIKDYNKIIELYPYYTEAYNRRAQIKYSLKDIEGAKRDIETGKLMAEVFHSKTNTQLNKDSLLVTQLTQLSADFTATLETKKDTVDINFRPIFYITEKTDNTSKNFSLYLENFNSKNGQNLCLKNTSVGDSTLLKRSLLKNQSNKEFMLISAIYKSNNQMLDDADEMLSKVLSKDTTNALAYLARGINYCRQIEILNNTDEAFLVSNPKQDNLENLRKIKCQQAISDFAKSLFLVPDFTYSIYNQAYVKCQLGDFYGALKDYETIIKLNPEFADAYYNYGFLLYYLNQKEFACQNFSRAGELGLSAAFTFIRKNCKGSLK